MAHHYIEEEEKERKERESKSTYTPKKYREETSPGNEDRHYRGHIQPKHLIESLEAEGLTGFYEGNIIKLASRWRIKGGIEDLKKIAWHLDQLMEIAPTILKARNDNA